MRPKKILGHALFVGALGLSTLMAAPACTENNVSVFILHNMAPPTNRQDGACVYQADPTQPKMSEGSIDLEVSDAYTMNILISNQMMPRGDQSNTRAETNRVHINGAVVRVTDANGGTIREFSTLGNGFADVGLNNTPGFGIVSLTGLDLPTLDLLRPSVQSPPPPAPPSPARLVVANVKVFGKTLGGVDVESGEFQFPIRVCSRCRIDFSRGDDPASSGLDCNLPVGGDEGEETATPCIPGQDENLDCRLCRGIPACNGL